MECFRKLTIWSGWGLISLHVCDSWPLSMDQKANINDGLTLRLFLEPKTDPFLYNEKFHCHTKMNTSYGVYLIQFLIKIHFWFFFTKIPSLVLQSTDKIDDWTEACSTTLKLAGFLHCWNNVRRAFSDWKFDSLSYKEENFSSNCILCFSLAQFSFRYFSLSELQSVFC